MLRFPDLCGIMILHEYNSTITERSLLIMEYVFSDKMSNLKASAIREILKVTTDPSIISFAAGSPAPDAFPVADITRILGDIMENEPLTALQYNITEGYPMLREAVKKRMERQHCFVPGKDELLITTGGQQAVELSCKILLNEGDVVISESPSFVGSLNSIKSYNAVLEGIEMDDEGIRTDLLEDVLKTHKNVKLMYLIPNFQNPTGKCMSWERRKQVYALAQKYNVIIIEDNPYGELRFEGEDIPSIKSLDTDGRVIYCSSFSKIVAPGLRVGYVSAAPEITGKIVACKQASDVHTTVMSQMICGHFLNECDMDAHLARLKELYKRKCGLMQDCISKYFSSKVTATHPQGGLFIWVTLPDGADMNGFCNKAVANKVAVVPGNAFLTDDTQPSSCFRMNFSTPTDEQLIEGCRILGALTKELFGE